MAQVIPTRPILLTLYGFPGAGKTYFARQFCEHVKAAHIQADRIRAELFEEPHYDKQENDVISQLMNYMVTEFLNAGMSVVYDTNAQRNIQRHGLRDLARKSKSQPVLVWLQVDADTSFLRGTKRDRRRIDDKYAAQLDRNMFDNIIGNMQNPSISEDYVVISGKHTFKTQYSAVSKTLRELGLLHVADTQSGIAKPELVNLVPNPAAGRVDLARRNIIVR